MKKTTFGTLVLVWGLVPQLLCLSCRQRQQIPSDIKVSDGQTPTDGMQLTGTYHLEAHDKKGGIFDASIVFLSDSTALTSAHNFYGNGFRPSLLKFVIVRDWTNKIVARFDPNSGNEVTIVPDGEVDSTGQILAHPRFDRLALIFKKPLKLLSHGTAKVARNSPRGEELFVLVGAGLGDYRLRSGSSELSPQQRTREAAGVLRYGYNRGTFEVFESSFQFGGAAIASDPRAAMRGGFVASTPGDSGGGVYVERSVNERCLVALASSDVSPDEVENRPINAKSFLIWWASPITTTDGAEFLKRVVEKGGAFSYCD